MGASADDLDHHVECSLCEPLRAGGRIPIGTECVTTHDIEWPHEPDGPRGEEVFVTIPLGTRCIIKEHADFIGNEYVMTDDGEIEIVVCPYFILFLEGPLAGERSAAYWCELSLPEGSRGR